MLDGGSRLDVRFGNGELQLLSGGVSLLQKIFLSDTQGPLAEAYWRFVLLRQNWKDASRLAGELSRLPAGTKNAAATQFIARVTDLATELRAIEQAESQMNGALYDIYG